MADITAQMVKALRDRTGAGMMECKKALETAGGDIEKGIEELRKRGIASAAKKTGRSAKQGTIVIKLSDDKTSGVIVEFNCESDFVARTDDFQSLVADLAEQALASANVKAPADLITEAYAKDPSITISDLITAKVAKIGENMKLARVEKLSGGVLGAYIHPGAQLGVLIQATGLAASTDEIQDLVRDIAMQVAAADPTFIARTEVTTEGGLDVRASEASLKTTRQRLNDAGIQVSLFIDPDVAQIDAAAGVGAQVIELHTGRYADHFNQKDQRNVELQRLVKSARHAFNAGLVVNAGHGLTTENVPVLQLVPHLNELNIGHTLISRALFIGLDAAIKEMLQAMAGYRA